MFIKILYMLFIQIILISRDRNSKHNYLKNLQLNLHKTGV